MLFFIILEQVHRPVRRVIKYAPLLPCHSGTRADLGAEGPTLAQHPVLNVNNTPSLIAYWVSVSLLTPPPHFLPFNNIVTFHYSSLLRLEWSRTFSNTLVRMNRFKVPFIFILNWWILLFLYSSLNVLNLTNALYDGR